MEKHGMEWREESGMEAKIKDNLLTLSQIIPAKQKHIHFRKGRG